MMKTVQGRRLFAVLLAFLCLSGTQAYAQSSETVEAEQHGVPVLVSLGAGTGFPGFNRFSVNAAMQYRSFGLNVKLAPTPAGLYFGGGLRGYLPFGGFVPLYLGAGGGAYGEGSELHLVLGGHVPVSEHFRIDFELGAARANAMDTASWLPWVTVGVSYSFPVETGATPEALARLAQSGGTVDPALCVLPPDEDGLISAFERTLSSFIRSAEATYGGSYTDLQYSYEITNVSMSDTSGTVTISYRGSVRSLVGGGRESASGTASASFSWNGCRWSRTSIDY